MLYCYIRSDRYPAKGRNEELWQFCPDKIFSPLHRGLSNLSHLITPMCTAILHYMGDRVQLGQPNYTRTIFEPPLRFVCSAIELSCIFMFDKLLIHYYIIKVLYH